MAELRNKKVLIFAPYGCTKHYGDAIKKELEARGASVVKYDERPSQKPLTKIVIRLFKKKIPQLFNKYIKKVAEQNKEIAFDYILICKGEAFTPLSIQTLRDYFPKARVILYLWDVMHDTEMKDVLASCDVVYSFDPEDVDNNPGLIFRPTFFVDEYKSVKSDPNAKYDVVFIGTLAGDRLDHIRRFKRLFESKGYSFYSYLYIPGLIMYLKDFIIKFPYISYKKIHLEPISLENTCKILDESKAILDINYTYQRSLSTRAHEAMAAHKKYITTNPEIKKYPYYDVNNILVIDRQNPSIPEEFFHTEFKEISPDILYRFSTSGLVDDLFGDNTTIVNNNE